MVTLVPPQHSEPLRLLVKMTGRVVLASVGISIGVAVVLIGVWQALS